MKLIIVFILTNALFTVASSSDGFNDQLCSQQFQFISDTITNGDTSIESWIISLFDSWGKIPSGITYGNLIDLGNYDQCLGVTNAETRSIVEIGDVTGQYCLLPISLNLSSLTNSGILTRHYEQSKALVIGGGSGTNPLAGGNLVFMNGICAPDSCEPNYLFGILRNTLSRINVTVVPMDPTTLCSNGHKINISPIDIVTIVIFAITTCLIIASTSYDAYKSINPSEGRKVWCLSFSAITNGKQLFSCAKSKSSDVIHCLNGIRVLSLVWVIYGHSYGMNIGSPVVNLMYIMKWIESIYSMVLIDATVSVDTFFVLSGLLVTWGIFKEMRRNNGSINVPLMYFHRYLRIIVPLIMAILFMMSFYKHFGDGPFGNMVSMFTNNCEKWWYTSLLFVQNYVNPNEMCLNHTWYLQVDMQLFILSPLLIIPLYLWGRKVIPIVCTLILLSIGCSFATFYVNKMKVSVLGGGGNMMGIGMEKIYFPTHIRMGSWLVGVLLGYVLHKVNGKNIKLPTWVQIVGWFVSLGTMGAVVFGPYNLNQIGYNENLIESSIYSSCSRVAWCIAVAWVIFACSTGHGYFINTFLSMNIWLPFTHLSYSMYLLSFIVQIYRVKTTRVATYFSDYNSIYSFWGDFSFTFMISIYWVLAFEYPVAKLESYFLRNRRTKVKESQKELITNDLPPISNEATP